MGDRPLIFAGLFLFLVLVTFPMWQGLAAKTTTAAPEIRKPAGQECVAPRDYMRASHMDLLMEWRDGKVREGVRRHTAPDGKTYAISLRGTCLNQCHGSKEKFCDSCHAYAGVPATGCWTCHPAPPADATTPETQRGSRI